MSDELLCLKGARHAVLFMINRGSAYYVKRLHDGTAKTVSWCEICDHLEDMIERMENDGKRNHKSRKEKETL